MTLALAGLLLLGSCTDSERAIPFELLAGIAAGLLLLLCVSGAVYLWSGQQVEELKARRLGRGWKPAGRERAS